MNRNYLRQNSQTGIFEYRRRWPEKVIESIHLMGLGKGEYFKRSTGKYDKREAIRISADLARQFEDICIKAEAGPVDVGLPVLMQMVSKWYDETYLQYVDAPGSWHAWTAERDGLVSVPGQSVPDDEADPAEYEDAIGTLADQILREHSISLKPNSRYLFLKHLNTNAYALYTLLIRRADGDFSEDPYRKSLPDFQQEQVSNATTGKDKELEALMEDYFKWYRRSRGVSKDTKPNKTETDYRRYFSLFIKQVGDKRPLSSLTRKDVIGFKNHLMDTTNLSTGTIKTKYIAGVNAILNYGIANERVPAGITDRIMDKEIVSKEAGYWPFQRTQARLLLRKARDQEAHKRWLVWIGAATGARIGEISQLMKEDIVTNQGIQCFDFNDRHSGKSVKNANSRRKVPIHPTLVAEGFLDWVNTRPSGHLFDWPLSEGQRKQKAGEWFKNFRREHGVEHMLPGKDKSKYAFHSWRHWFEDQMDDALIPDGLQKAITGRMEQGSAGLYGQGALMETLLDQISNISFDFVDEKEENND